jgi:hypothetical protein
LRRGRDHVCTFLDKDLGDPLADAAGRAGDDGDFFAQCAHALSLRRSSYFDLA